MGQPKRSPEDAYTEQQAIIRSLRDFFEARGEPPVLPLLASRGKSSQLEKYTELRDRIVEAVQGCINSIRESQKWKRLLNSMAAVVEAISALAGGAVERFDNHSAFIELAART